jgi:Icc-related predicted phosphoesterase
MLIRAIADQHGYLPAIEPCDLLLIAGDVCPATNHNVHFEYRWLSDPFLEWLDVVAARHIVGIAGNHDFIFMGLRNVPPRFKPALRWSYLEESTVEIEGLTIFGTPWTPWFNNWAFNAPKDDESEAFLRKKLSAVPADTDILISHGPPYGYGDLTERGERAGSKALLETIERVQPRLCVCGHIHDGRGQWQIDRTLVANATLLDGKYELTYEPMAFELDIGRSETQTESARRREIRESGLSRRNGAVAC